MRTHILVLAMSLVLSVGAANAQSGLASRSTTTASTQTRPAPPPATQPTLKGAKYLYWHGRYGEAITLYEKLAANPADAVAAGIGLAEARGAVGKYEQAITALKAIEARSADKPEWHVAMAKALAAIGKYEEALAAARQAVKLADDSAAAIGCLGDALETLGRKQEAVEVYKNLTKAIDKRDFARDAPSLVAAGGVLDRIAVLTGKKASEQSANILQNYYQKAYLEADKEYWPANVAAGMFLLTKYKPAQAEQEFKLAEKLNNSIPDVLVGRGAALLGNWQFEQAVAQADKALAINPQHADAFLLKAYTLFQWRKYDQVAPMLEKVLAFNPNHLEALSLLAALHIHQRNEDKAKPYIDKVLKINPVCGQLYDTIGQQLSSSRQFPQAEKYLKQAIETAPELAGPVTNLGLMYMQTGQEDLAKQTLDKAFALDDFRGDVLNYLKLLDELSKFQVKETPHFVIKVDGKLDGVLLDWLADVAETIHADVAKDFNHTPPEKVIVELFPNQSQFSVRITGRGWIGTVGACTGRVIAMPAPDPLRGGFGTFNWATVLRHEYTHAVTLSATGNRIPHWFTEACAVWEQPDPRNYQAVQLLVDAIRTGKLYPVKSLDWGFIRPTPGGGSRSMSYAQSEWIFEYIVEKHGYETINKMLTAFRDGQGQAEIFQKLLGVTEDQFDKDFNQWARGQVQSWGFDPDPTPDLTSAASAASANPKSADAQATLALAQYRRGQTGPAEQSARKALEIDARNKRALEVLGTVLAAGKKTDEALDLAKRLEEVDSKSAPAARIKSDIYLAKRQWADAIAALEALKFRQRLDPFSYEKLAELYMQMGQAESALPNLIELHHRTVTDPKYARRIADIYRSGTSPDKALEFYEQIIQINPYDAGAYKAMAPLYVSAKRYDRAVLAANSACLLEPKNPDLLTLLAKVDLAVYRATKDAHRLSDARTAAQKAVEIDPGGPARDVLEMIEQEGK